MVAATAQLEWIMELYDQLANAQYQPGLDGKRVKQWDMGLAEKNIHMDIILVARVSLPTAVVGSLPATDA